MSRLNQANTKTMETGLGGRHIVGSWGLEMLRGGTRATIGHSTVTCPPVRLCGIQRLEKADAAALPTRHYQACSFAI